MIIFDDFYREEVRRCYKEIEALEIENESLKERINHFIRCSCDSEWKRSLKILRLRNKIGSGKQDRISDVAIQETEVKNAAF